jgi:hypothetical protein
MTMPREEDYYTNPRTEMAPEDYAPTYDLDDFEEPFNPIEQGYYDDDPNVYDGTYSDGGDDD